MLNSILNSIFNSIPNSILNIIFIWKLMFSDLLTIKLHSIEMICKI